MKKIGRKLDNLRAYLLLPTILPGQLYMQDAHGWNFIREMTANLHTSIKIALKASFIQPPLDVSLHRHLFLTTDWVIHNGPVISDLHIKLNLQECFRFCIRFSSWCLGPWMNPLLSVWWSTFRFRFLNWHLVWKYCLVEKNLLRISFLCMFFVQCPSFVFFLFSRK